MTHRGGQVPPASSEGFHFKLRDGSRKTAGVEDTDGRKAQGSLEGFQAEVSVPSGVTVLEAAHMNEAAGVPSLQEPVLSNSWCRLTWRVLAKHHWLAPPATSSSTRTMKVRPTGLPLADALVCPSRTPTKAAVSLLRRKRTPDCSICSQPQHACACLPRTCWTLHPV